MPYYALRKITTTNTHASIEQNNQVASEILLVDPKTELRDAQVQDLSDATYHGNTSTRVRAAEHAEAGQCDIIVVTAGAAQKKGKDMAPISPSPFHPSHRDKAR